MEEAGITHFQIGMPGNKEPFVNSNFPLFLYNSNVYNPLLHHHLPNILIIFSLPVPKEGVADALRAVLDRRNHPTLIHCNKGKVHPPSKIQGAATKQLNPTVPLTLQLNMQHRTGCVVGCLRKIQQWGLTLIFDEYRRHSHPKSRALDQQFIELFDHSDLIELARENGWLPERYPKSTSDARVEAPGPMSS